VHNDEVSGGRQPPLSDEKQLSETAATRPLHRSRSACWSQAASQAPNPPNEKERDEQNREIPKPNQLQVNSRRRLGMPPNQNCRTAPKGDQGDAEDLRNPPAIQNQQAQKTKPELKGNRLKNGAVILR
jgi:hypothetical protein